MYDEIRLCLFSHWSGKTSEPAKLGSGQRLVTTGFDAEAIWAQLSARCDPALQFYTKHTDRLVGIDEAEPFQLLKALAPVRMGY